MSILIPSGRDGGKHCPLNWNVSINEDYSSQEADVKVVVFSRAENELCLDCLGM